MERNKRSLKKNIYIIVGSTSSGKTSLALKLAQEFNGVIFSADSRQMYKYLDIGTGKIPQGSKDKIQIKKRDNKWVVNDIDIWGYDMATPDIQYSVYDYASNIIPIINDYLINSNKKIFIVGGTGLYIDVLVGKLHLDTAPINETLRDKLQESTIDELQKMYRSLNAPSINSSDIKNKQRLIRKIEKYKQTNTTDITQKELPKLIPAKHVYIGLTCPRQYIYDKVDTWLDNIWGKEIFDEIHSAIELGYDKSTKLQGLVYKQALEVISNTKTSAEAKQKAKYALHAYIRRQQTWFKKNMNIRWFDICDKDMYLKIKSLIK